MEEWLEIQDLSDRVEDLLDIGLCDDALALLEPYAVLYQDEWELYFLYSRVYMEKNNPREAIPYLYKSLKLDKKNVDVLLGLFYAFAQLDHFKKAAKYLLRAERYNPDVEAVLSAMIWYCTELNQFDRAIGYFEKALKIGTDNPDTFRNAAITYERIGDHENAETCFKTALQLNPQFDEARDLLADHFLFRGEPHKSVALYQEYLKQSPRNIRTLSRLVFCLSQNDQMDDALALAQETVRLYPNSPVGYVDCAYAYLNSGRLDLALQSANKALDVSPIDAEALRVKAIAYSEKQENKEAQKVFEAALALEPHNPEIMRDYYHHLRNMGNFSAMEKFVYAVIRQEHPYCIEDYWFLADFYREQGDNLRAFHFLHSAYESMPGEKELIPPMIDIMLDTGHVRFTTPFLKHYAEKNGWNDIMVQFARHKRLKGKWNQEGMRFLRYYCEKPSEFRKYVFLVYLEKFMLAGLLLLFPFLAVFCFVLKGIPGVLVLTAFSVLLAAGWKSAKILFKW